MFETTLVGRGIWTRSVPLAVRHFRYCNVLIPIDCLYHFVGALLPARVKWTLSYTDFFCLEFRRYQVNFVGQNNHVIWFTFMRHLIILSVIILNRKNTLNTRRTMLMMMIIVLKRWQPTVCYKQTKHYCKNIVFYCISIVYL